MEIKKTKGATLENQKSVYVQIGLILVLSVMFIALEWTTTDVQMKFIPFENPLVIENDIVPIIRQEEVKSPPPPPQPAETLTIVDDGMVIDEEIIIIDSEVRNDTRVDNFIPSLRIDEEIRDEVELVYWAEEMPEFPGGQEALLRYLSSSIRYPIIAQENRISGKVFVQFVINIDGGVTDVTIARSVDPSLDREAIRVVQTMPKWKPGMQRNRAVRVSYTLPINFVLQQ